MNKAKEEMAAAAQAAASAAAAADAALASAQSAQATAAGAALVAAKAVATLAAAMGMPPFVCPPPPEVPCFDTACPWGRVAGTSHTWCGGGVPVKTRERSPAPDF